MRLQKFRNRNRNTRIPVTAKLPTANKSVIKTENTACHLSLTHLAQYLFQVLSPQNEDYYGQQNKDDAHQEGDQNSCIADVILGYRETRSGSRSGKFWPTRKKIQNDMSGVYMCMCLIPRNLQGFISLTWCVWSIFAGLSLSVGMASRWSYVMHCSVWALSLPVQAHTRWSHTHTSMASSGLINIWWGLSVCVFIQFARSYHRDSGSLLHENRMWSLLCFSTAL